MALTLSVLALTSFVALTATGVADAAKPAQIGGTVTNLPAKNPEGRAVQVVAVHFPDGAVVDSDRADGRGRFALEVPAGVNALLTQVIPLGGPRSTSVLGAAIKLKAGEKRKVKVRAKKKRRRKPGHGGGGNGGQHSSELAREAKAAAGRVVAEDGRVYPGESFAFRSFTGATGGWAFANNGLPDMFTTDIVEHLGAPAGCEYTLVERRRFDTIAQEIALGQSGLVDPNTAVRPGHQIPVELWIEGTLTNQFDFPAPLRYEIRIVEAATGNVRATLRGFLSENFFAEQAALAERLVQAMCGATEDAPPPAGSPRYSGQISGTHTITGIGAAPLEIAWSGNVEFTLTGEVSSFPTLPEPGPYGQYETTSGSLHATLHHITDEGCTWSGETDFAIGAPGNYGTLYVQEGAAQPAYTLGVAPATDSIPFTQSGPSCSGTGQWGLNGYAYAYTPTYQTSPSPVLVGSATYAMDSSQTETYNWNLSPGG